MYLIGYHFNLLFHNLSVSKFDKKSYSLRDMNDFNSTYFMYDGFQAYLMLICSIGQPMQFRLQGVVGNIFCRPGEHAIDLGSDFCLITFSIPNLLK